MSARLADPSKSPKRGPGGSKPLTDDVYNALWIDRVKRRTVIDANGCWLWQGRKTPTWRYAQTAYRRRSIHCHRQMYMIVHKVKLTPDQYVCHTCDVRHCVNPDHLWLGSNSDNQKDAGRKGRHAESSKTHCPQGHEYTPENTRVLASASGGLARQCKECNRIRSRIKLGWSEEEAANTPTIPKGHRTVGDGLSRARQPRANVAFLQSLLPEIPK